MLERQNLLDRNFPPCGLVHSSDHGSVSAFTEAMEDAVVITCGQMREKEGQLLGSCEVDGQAGRMSRSQGCDILTDFELGKRLSGLASRHAGMI